MSFYYPTKAAAKNISLITIMFCFNEFAFTAEVKHKINSIQILGFILICLYFYHWPFPHMCTLHRMQPIYLFNSWLSFQRLGRLIVQSTVLPSLSCRPTADVMWNAHWVEFTRTDCVSALVRWNTTQIIMFKLSSTPAQLRVISAHLSYHRQWVWVDPVRQYSGDCDQVIVAAGGSTSHVRASVPDYTLRFLQNVLVVLHSTVYVWIRMLIVSGYMHT